MGWFQKRIQRPYVSAVVLADSLPCLIDETPLVLQSVSCFESCRLVDEIVLVCREERIAEYYTFVQEYGFQKITGVVGSANQPVLRGADACSEQAEFYAIHNGVRPLITSDEIQTCILTAIQYGAAAVACPSADMVRNADGNGLLQPASGEQPLYYTIRSPYVCSAEQFHEAARHASTSRCSTGDFFRLMEQCGYRWRISPGSEENIQVTTPETLAIAQTILSYREQGVEQWLAYE